MIGERIPHKNFPLRPGLEKALYRRLNWGPRIKADDLKEVGRGDFRRILYSLYVGLFERLSALKQPTKEEK